MKPETMDKQKEGIKDLTEVRDSGRHERFVALCGEGKGRSL